MKTRAIRRQPRPTPPVPFPRQPWPDRIRGSAVLLMVAYHFCFDLDHYGLIHQNFNTDGRWLGFRAVIISLFMATLGASVLLAHPLAVQWRALWRRQLRLGAACVAVSLGSSLMFPASWIWFGTLHFAWVATWLALLLRPLAGHWLLLPLAAVLIWAGNGPAFAAFDHPWLGWVGLMTHKPYTEDYVPLLPWFAAVVVGLWFAGRGLAGPGLDAPGLASPGLAMQGAGAAAVHADAASPSAAADRSGAGRRVEIEPPRFRRLDAALRQLGRHSLLVYLLHQPVLIGLFELRQLIGP